MGNSIEIPFAVGEQVYWIGYFGREEARECPECCGTKFLTMIQGNGVQVRIDCACCSRGFDGPIGVVKVQVLEHKPTPVTLGEVRVDGKKFSYGINDRGGSVDSDVLFRLEADCLACCEKKNSENAKYREEQAISHLKSKRREMAWSVHYWQGQVRRFRDDLKRVEDMLGVCKAKEEKKVVKA